MVNGHPPGWLRFLKCKNGSKHRVKAGGDQTSYDPDHIDWQDHLCIHLNIGGNIQVNVKGLNMDHLSRASGCPLQTLDTKLGRPPRLHSFRWDIRDCRWLYVYIPIWQKNRIGVTVGILSHSCSPDLELLPIKCRLHVLPREFSLVIITAALCWLPSSYWQSHTRDKYSGSLLQSGIATWMVAQWLALSPKSKNVLGSIPGWRLVITVVHCLAYKHLKVCKTLRLPVGNYTWVKSNSNLHKGATSQTSGRVRATKLRLDHYWKPESQNKRVTFSWSLNKGRLKLAK